MLRRFLTILLAMLPLSLAAQPKLEPLPPPPPAIGPGAEAPLGEAPVTITPGPNDKIEDVIVNGERAVKVTSPDGKTSYFATGFAFGKEYSLAKVWSEPPPKKEGVVWKP